MWKYFFICCGFCWLFEKLDWTTLYAITFFIGVALGMISLFLTFVIKRRSAQ